ncbi:MAG: PEP-utilizing enzyme, partial [Anaerolineae bacterium]|nr:PEP-utilizing enzyme [Anaerolineae bacterium]
LALLKQNGFKVPPGLVLTAHFFEAQLKHARLLPLWTGSPDIEVTAEALQWLADDLKTKPLAPELAQALRAQLDLVLGPAVASFAVRSSVIDEDQRDHTFAGVHLTELGVPRAALVIAITRCWASALSGPAIQYRVAHGMQIQSIGIAVLIQPLLVPTSAGVGFTINPVSGARDELIIEATYGLGDRLVSGHIQPHLYRVHKQPPNYPLIEQQTGDVPASTVKAVPARSSPLTSTAAAELAQLLDQIQALMGEPQDVEWARLENAFFILQSRPVATNKISPQYSDQEWSRASHLEAVPELPSPFFGSLLERSQNQIMFYLRDLGLDLEKLGPYEKLILGRPYLNLTLFKRALAQAGINPEAFLEATGYTKATPADRIFSIDWQSAWKARRVYFAIFKRVQQIENQVKDSEAVAAEVVDILVTFDPAASRAVLLSQLQQQIRVFSSLTTSSLSLNSSIGLIIGLCSRIVGPVSSSPANIIRVLALKGVRSSQVALNESLVSLGHLARGDPQVRRILSDSTDNLAAGSTAASINSPVFGRAFDEIMENFGERADYEADPAYPRYSEDPTSLLQIVRQYANDDPDADANSAAATWQNLTTSPTGLKRGLPWRYWLAQPLIALLRRLFRIRNEFDGTRARAMAACRRWDLALGHSWAEAGWLERSQDIFWLTVPEIEQAIMQETNAAVTLSSTIKARQDTYRSYANTEMPSHLKDSQLPSIQVGVGLSSDRPSDVILGLPISPGQSRGRVVVMLQPQELEPDSNDDIILVMPSTDPAWLAQLPFASGLIVEKGGLLSHGSIIAREYGLPAVANIPHATQRFRTGETVLVDGSTGIVQRLESHSVNSPSR